MEALGWAEVVLGWGVNVVGWDLVGRWLEAGEASVEAVEGGVGGGNGVQGGWRWGEGVGKGVSVCLRAVGRRQGWGWG